MFMLMVFRSIKSPWNRGIFYAARAERFLLRALLDFLFVLRTRGFRGLRVRGFLVVAPETEKSGDQDSQDVADTGSHVIAGLIWYLLIQFAPGTQVHIIRPLIIDATPLLNASSSSLVRPLTSWSVPVRVSLRNCRTHSLY